MKIVQFGLHYSPNVGDGIIAECIVHEAKRLFPQAEVVTVDLSGRLGFQHAVVRNRALALKVLGLLPSPLRGRVVEARLKPIMDRVAPEWRAAAADADLALIGGGQIFSDADLNFCVKVARAAHVLKDAKVPVAIYAAGVAQNWSRRGAELFQQVFDADLRQVGLRDAGSITAWRDQTGDAAPAPVLARDPGLLAADCYGPAPRPGTEIGLCVMDTTELALHADGAVVGGPEFFSDLAGELARRGHEVLLFCNGAENDRAALAEVARRALGDRIHAAPPPDTPAELAGIIRSCRAVIAHRMHACIVSYAYGLPVVGLGWDSKLRAFFQSIEAEDWFTDAADARPDAIAARIEQAIATGIAPVTHARVLAETSGALANVLKIAEAHARERTAAA